MAAALRSVPPPPEPNRDIEKKVRSRQEAANGRLNRAGTDPTAKVLALASNLTSAMGLLSLRQQGEVLASVVPALTQATAKAYRTALARKRGGGQ